MDMSLIQGTISGLKIAGDIAKGFLELKSIADVQEKVIELQSAILSAQSSALSANADQAAMADEIRKLKEEISRVKAWESKKLRYKLHSPWAGAMASRLIGFVHNAMRTESPPFFNIRQALLLRASMLAHAVRMFILFLGGYSSINMLPTS